MRIAVLAATGSTGRHLLEQALDRGHTVVALVRNPAAHLPPGPTLETIQVDVQDGTSIAKALDGVDAVVSGLGLAKGGRPGTLTAGAVALTAAHTGGTGPHIVWLGAYGSGLLAQTAGPALRLLLKLALGSELADKAAADDIVLRAGATVFHAGPLTNGSLSATRRTVVLEDAPQRLLPRTVSRATVAAAMLDEAENPRYSGHITLPLTQPAPSPRPPNKKYDDNSRSAPHHWPTAGKGQFDTESPLRDRPHPDPRH
jgi:uncharacterized protein YbjT (DUF2867 family)